MARSRFLYSDRLTIVTECYDQEQHILDLGSGPGIILERLLAANPQARGVAVDIAAALDSIHHPRITPLTFDLRDLFVNRRLPLPDEQFDLVLATEMLEHMLYPEAILAEAYRLLAPGGKLLVTVPNLVSLEKRFSLLIGSGRGMLGICGIVYEQANDHIRWYTFRALKLLLQQTGFEVVPRRSADFPLRVNRIGLGRLLCRLFPSLAEKIVIKATKVPVENYSVCLYDCPLHNRPMPILLHHRCAAPQPAEAHCQQCRYVWIK